MITPLPAPRDKYDRQNEAEARRTIEQELLNTNEALLQAQSAITILQARLLAAGIP